MKWGAEMAILWLFIVRNVVKGVVFAAKLAILAVLLAILAGLIFLRFGAGPAADQILANVKATNDREFPVTVQSVRQSAEDIQSIGGMGQGLNCSLDKWVEFLVFPRKSNEASINLQIRQACAFHDMCYRHGARTYGYSQLDCDTLLQEHAFKLCKFFMAFDRLEACYTRARLVLLGVRFGGSGAFQEGASTYYEFDPFPYRSSRYRVIRIADTPHSWMGRGAEKKSIYVFDIKPSGVRVTIFAKIASAKQGKDFCTVYDLAGAFSAMTIPPIVAKTAGGQDVFVWWRRQALSRTGGNFILLEPSQAGVQDWARAFGVATEVKPDFSCETDLVPLDPMTTFKRMEQIAATTITGPGLDLEFSEFHIAPWSSRDGSLGDAFALKTHTCKRGTNLLCFHIFKIARDFEGLALRSADIRGFTARTGKFEVYGQQDQGNSINIAKVVKPKEKEQDRYRSFVLPPFAMRSNGKIYLGIVRRGSENGEGYGNSSVIRRFAVTEAFLTEKKKVNTGQSFGRVLLSDHAEADDPFIVIGNEDVSNTQIISVRADIPGDTNAAVEISSWKMPPLETESPGYEDTNIPPRRTVARVVNKLCDQMKLRADYMRVPPKLTAASSATPALYFFDYPFAPTDVNTPNVTAAKRRVLSVPLGGLATSPSPDACLDFDFQSVELTRTFDAATLKRLKSAPDKREHLTIAKLDSLVTMLEDMDGDGKLEMLLADLEFPWFSFRDNGFEDRFKYSRAVRADPK